MHATLKQIESIHRALPYNELKVRQEQAEFLGGENFVKEARDLSYDEKLFHFNRLIELNDRGYKPVLHIFLRFNRGDALSSANMLKVTQDYMEGMGLGRQPWLAYRHNDTLHSHVHVVSTKIQSNGQRIRITPGVLEFSRKLTHELERRYGLDQGDEEATMRAQHRYLQKVEYSKVSVYPAIKIVLDTIVPTYRYTNLEELNAVLGLFNVKASRGLPESRTHQHRGLLYYPLLPDGREGPAFIKASAFPARPTLDRLEQRFAENIQLRAEHTRRLTSTIDYALAGSQLSFLAFRQEMARQGVNIVTPREDSGQQIWYVDQRTKAVFEGAALGERYTGAAVRQRCMPEETYQRQQQLRAQEETQRQGYRARHSL